MKKNKITDKQIEIIAEWVTNNETTLKSLYADFLRDTNDRKTTFIAFAEYMYGQCKH